MAIKNTGNFSGGSVAAPDIGSSIRAFSDLNQQIAQQEQNKIANARAQEQLDLQKQQYADQQAAKAAGSKYMADLGRVLESGVVSQADQAKLAALSQNQTISPEERARQIDAMLPKMSDAYQKDTTGQLKLLQGVQASPLLDTRDKVALLGSLADPLEKRLDRDTKYGYDVKLQEAANAKALELERLRYDHDLKKIAAEKEAQKGLWKDKTEFDREHTWMYDPKTSEKKFYKDLTADERKTWIDNDTRKALLESSKAAAEIADKQAELKLKQDKPARELAESITKLVDNAGNPEATGSKIAKMRAAGMPDMEIRNALAAATGGEIYDFGKPDYNQGVLQSRLDDWISSGKKDTTTKEKQVDKSVLTPTASKPEWADKPADEIAKILERTETNMAELYDKMRTTPTKTGDRSVEAEYNRLKKERDMLKASLIDPNILLEQNY